MTAIRSYLNSCSSCFGTVWRFLLCLNPTMNIHAALRVPQSYSVMLSKFIYLTELASEKLVHVLLKLKSHCSTITSCFSQNMSVCFLWKASHTFFLNHHCIRLEKLKQLMFQMLIFQSKVFGELTTDTESVITTFKLTSIKAPWLSWFKIWTQHM